MATAPEKAFEAIEIARSGLDPQLEIERAASIHAKRSFGRVGGAVGRTREKELSVSRQHRNQVRLEDGVDRKARRAVRRVAPERCEDLGVAASGQEREHLLVFRVVEMGEVLAGYPVRHQGAQASAERAVSGPKI